ncbi:hypothetical protein BV22DRAFT_1031790 [Leucogyrophana mollusca]|uniref:Uncharacterized protein n=1 Tax=Leucogyrophana mollusca TaxID=85980 RepID=A0ACB8BQN1_9AGAM|nr:hypothetical protein BV22DRAFT_1031790 [Leucogyrophana mollusca]
MANSLLGEHSLDGANVSHVRGNARCGDRVIDGDVSSWNSALSKGGRLHGARAWRPS